MLGALLLLLPRAAAAQEPNQAGLVVVKGDGTVLTRCVEFAGESINGYDLIAASGIEFNVEPAAMGATVCSLDGQGCRAPQESCFCQCQSSPCLYWSYWTLEADGWTYSNRGASTGQARPGDVQAWVWGAGTVDQAPEPPALAFADICPAPAAAIAATTAAAALQPAAETTVMVPTPASPAPVTADAALGARSWLWLAVAAVLPLVLLALRRRAN